MVNGLLPDINVDGHVRLLRRIWEGETWREIWTALALPVLTFEDVGLPSNASDVAIGNAANSGDSFSSRRIGIERVLIPSSQRFVR